MLAEILNDARASSKSLAEIRELIEKALDPSRDTITYFPDGESLTSNQNAGFNSTMAIGEHHVYEQFIQLENSKNWPALLGLVSSEKAKVPRWFTVDYVSSEAYLHNCELDKAVEVLDVFMREVANSPNYGDMLKKAQQVRSDLETDKDAIRRNCSAYGQPFNR